jgi:hypothetical protein
MHNIAIRKVRDLGADARQLFQLLLGRTLHEEEEVAVLVRQPHGERLLQILDHMAQKAAHVPEQELDALIDEALNHARQRKP